ncbi:MAG: fumarylacetoacetate hydrolase family protein [Lachnospiraceae bacterium]|jgi:2-keto-4-pentenoate hydratase/2-oxohepta-3-ene-1,7-dioic acid hydratase in catechol pathway|nr:fumarylacetoacetate hydrolase family protein [Lachnospiraceae bacterium]
MKLLTFKYEGVEQVGVIAKDEISLHPISRGGITYKTMNDLIDSGTQTDFETIKALSQEESGSIALKDIKMMAPIPLPKQDIICLGINYAAHAEESARFKREAFEKDQPALSVYFSKRVDLAVADGEYIQSHRDIVDSLDYEAELAVIIGKDGKNIAKDKVYDHIFGYTILNDVSARNLQTKHKQWYFGKSLDGFTPMGPWIVTVDEFDNPPVLAIKSRVNGELRQNSCTDLMITTIEDAICELSSGITLRAGTIISMGTPAGVGMGFAPPKFLNKGDVVECEIEGIGCLKNYVD